MTEEEEFLSPGLIVCMLIISLGQKIRKFIFKETVIFSVASSSSEEVDRLPFPICSQQNFFYVSLSARREKKALVNQEDMGHSQKRRKTSSRQRELIAEIFDS